jgi:O-methyltransferase
MRQQISHLIKQVAFELIRATGELPTNSPEIRHAPVLLENATYSPWLSDRYFPIAMERVWGYAAPDRLRCYELWSLIQQSKKLSGGAFVEVGNWRGDTGCFIAQAAAFFGIPDRVYLCDKFERRQVASTNQRAEPGPVGESSKSVVDALIARLRLENVQVVPGIFPAETAPQVDEPGFRFAHICVDDQSAKEALEYLWPRLLPGGVVVFRYYGTYGCTSLTRLVNDEASRGDRIFIHNLNGHGMFVKLKSH